MRHGALLECFDAWVGLLQHTHTVSAAASTLFHAVTARLAAQTAGGVFQVSCRLASVGLAALVLGQSLSREKALGCERMALTHRSAVSRTLWHARPNALPVRPLLEGAADKAPARRMPVSGPFPHPASCSTVVCMLAAALPGFRLSPTCSSETFLAPPYTLSQTGVSKQQEVRFPDQAVSVHAGASPNTHQCLPSGQAAPPVANASQARMTTGSVLASCARKVWLLEAQHLF